MDAQTLMGTDATVEQRCDEVDVAYSRAKQIVGKDRKRIIWMHVVDAYTVLARAAVTAALTLVTAIVFYAVLRWPEVRSVTDAVDSRVLWTPFWILFAIYLTFDAGRFTRTFDAEVSKFASEILERERIRAEIDKRVALALKKHALQSAGAEGDL